MSDRIPDLTEEIIGWRAWDFREQTVLKQPRLFSLVHRSTWRSDDWTVAECGHCRDIPGDRCSCGMYAATTREHLSELGYDARHGVVIGEVGLAGKVVIGKMGYRAEKARPLRLFVAYFDWRLVRPLRETFRIPVELANPSLEED